MAAGEAETDAATVGTDGSVPVATDIAGVDGGAAAGEVGVPTAAEAFAAEEVPTEGITANGRAVVIGNGHVDLEAVVPLVDNVVVDAATAAS